jgi:hypothetical protein
VIFLHVLTGARAGTRIEAKDFPVTVGRSADNSVPLPEPGVFDQHFEIRFGAEGFSLVPKPPATISVNNAPNDGGLLRNGDVIGAGYAKIQFWLGPLAQRSLKPREFGTWLLIAAVAAAQIYLVTRLLEMAR